MFDDFPSNMDQLLTNGTNGFSSPSFEQKVLLSKDKKVIRHKDDEKIIFYTFIISADAWGLYGRIEEQNIQTGG